jgi:hypothetical protein
MPEGWDGTTRDPDEVLYEISMKEDNMLYEEFVQRLEFNKKKVRILHSLCSLKEIVHAVLSFSFVVIQWKILQTAWSHTENPIIMAFCGVL